MDNITLQDKLESSKKFYFFPSDDISKGPDVGGLGFENLKMGQEAFLEILNRTERGFIRMSIYILGATIKIIINDLKNRRIVNIENISISSNDLAYLKEAYVDHKDFSFGFGVFPNERLMQVYPITSNEVVLSVKSWELIQF